MLPPQTRENRGAIAMKGYSTFPQFPGLLEPHHKIVSCQNRTLVGWWSYPSTEMQLLYSTAPVDWAKETWTRNLLNTENQLVWCTVRMAHHSCQHQKVNWKILKLEHMISCLQNGWETQNRGYRYTADRDWRRYLQKNMTDEKKKIKLLFSECDWHCRN